MDNSFGNNDQQRVRDNAIPIKQNGTNFAQENQTMQHHLDSIFFFSSLSCITNHSTAQTAQTLPTTTCMLTSSNICRSTNESTISNTFSRTGLQSSRNLLITNLAQVHYDFIREVINDLYQHSIHQTFSKHELESIAVVILFYEIDQAKKCHSQVSHLLEHEEEFNMAKVSLCSNDTVSSVFGIELENLQDTHLALSIFGPPSVLGIIDFKDIVQSFGELHYLTKIGQSEVKLTLLMEYKDTRHAVAAKNALHDRVEQGAVFKAYLIKPELGQSNTNTTQQPFDQFPLPIGHRNSLQGLSSSIHTSASHLASSYSVFSGLDNQWWLSSLSPPSARFLRSPSLQTFLLKCSSPVNGLPQQNISGRVPSRSFKNPNHPDSRAAFNSVESPTHHHPQNSAGPYVAMPWSAPMTCRNDISIHQKEVDGVLRRRLSLGSSFTGDLQDVSLTENGQYTPSGYSSGSDIVTTTTEKDAQSYIGPPTPSSLTSADHLTLSSQAINETVTIDTAKNSTHEFDANKVINQLDKRTTFMIRNIPNKYTQAMLMEWLDSTHKKTYDFLYLRMDFKNKCNVGYAFINFIDYMSVVSFAKERVGKHWAQFNSEKRCQLSYARIQGKANLIEKFRNSHVMAQEASFRPKIFYSSGPHKGEEEEFPKSSYPLHYFPSIRQ